MSKKILVVDDSSLMRKRVCSVLEDDGHIIIGSAKNGKEAIEQYKLLSPDVVTMDVTMREMDGFSAAKEIMSYDSNASIIFLSNLNESKYSEDAQRLGAVGYVNKHKTKDILDLIKAL